MKKIKTQKPEKTQKPKLVTITRKIEICLHGYEGPAFKNAFDTLYKWRETCFKAANLIATHHMVHEQIGQFFYLSDDAKRKLLDIKKDENGIFTTSNQNTTYQMLSKLYKGDMPMDILGSLNNQIVSSFNKEKSMYFKGERSLRNYKNTIPIPVQTSGFINIAKSENTNYYFTLYGLNFRTNFGKDLSGNRIIFERSLENNKFATECVDDTTYKFCNSSIQIDRVNGKTSIYLLAVFQFKKLRVDIDPDRIAYVSLGMDTPIILKFGDGDPIKIGSREEFLHRRLAIQGGLHRAQISSTFNKGGKGIQKKIAAINRYKEAEISYVNSRMHKYSAKLIDLCLKYRIGKIVMENITDVKDEAGKDKYLLRNWSYFGLNEKINYKAGKYNMEVVTSKEEK
jgi:IS605 OrfB family transposase